MVSEEITTFKEMEERIQRKEKISDKEWDIVVKKEMEKSEDLKVFLSTYHRLLGLYKEYAHS